MNIFFAPNAALATNVSLDETESAHAVQVLRMIQGDAMELFDGNGNLFAATLTYANRKAAIATVHELKRTEAKQNFLHLAMAPTKQMERMEWFVEKAVELGVSEITPIICERSERRILKTERLKKQIVSACKQSKQLHLPCLNEAMPFSEFIKTRLPELRCIAWCEANSNHFKDAVAQSENVVCMIGPEGDFTAAEIDKAKSQSFQPVTFGQSILRAETAGVYAAAVYRTIKGL